MATAQRLDAPSGARRRGRSARLFATVGAVLLAVGTFAAVTPAAGAATRAQAVTAPQIAYQGGPLLTHVKVIAVLYGAPEAATDYPPEVTATTGTSLSDFLANLTRSPYMDLLSEYSADAKAIRDGSFLAGPRPDGLFAITPSAADNGPTVDDADIQAELSAHVGVDLPPADQNTLYMVYFRTGQAVTVPAPGGGELNSEVAPGFCAFHNSIEHAPANIRYVVVPAGASKSWCGKSVGFGNVTAASSLELAEAVTDPEPMTGWVNPTTANEIADVCPLQQTLRTPDRHSYIVQQVWSNEQRACAIDGPPRFVGVGAASVVEGDSGQRQVQIPVTLTAPAQNTVTVSYHVIGLTEGSGTVVFPGSKKGSPVVEMITLAVPGDTTVEGDQPFEISIHASPGYGVVRSSDDGLVINDDPESGNVVSVGDASAIASVTNDGTIPVPVTLSTPSSTTVTVAWAVTAPAGSMRLLTGTLHGTLNIPAHSTGALINVTTKATKSLLTGDGTMKITLSAPMAGFRLGRAVGTISLLAP